VLASPAEQAQVAADGAWVSYVDPASGQTYYVNAATKESRWSTPPPRRGANQRAGPAAGSDIVVEDEKEQMLRPDTFAVAFAGTGSSGELPVELEHDPASGGDGKLPPPLPSSLQALRASAAQKLLSLGRTLKAAPAAAPDRLGEDSVGTLHVTVHSCEELKVADEASTGLSDPYVVIQVEQQSEAKPAVKRQEMRTPFIPQTLNPVWSAGNQFALPIADASVRLLMCHVYDDDGAQAPDYLGGIAVPVADYIQAATRSGIMAFDLGACPDPHLVEAQGAAGITGRLFLSFYFEPRTVDQQKHPMGWVEVTVLSAKRTDAAALLLDVEPAAGAKAAAKMGSAAPGAFVQLHMQQPGPALHPESTPCLTVAAVTGEVAWVAGNQFSLEVRSSMASLVLQLREKASAADIVKNARGVLTRKRSSIMSSNVCGEAQLPLCDIMDETAPGPIELDLQLGPHVFQKVNTYISSAAEAGHFDEHGKFIRDADKATGHGSIRIRLEWKKWVPPPPPIGELLVKAVLAEGLLRADTFGENDTYVTMWLEQSKGSDAVAYRKHRTTTVCNSKDPLFPDPAFMLRVRDVNAKLMLHVWDEDVGTDDFLGEGTFSVATAIAEPNVVKLVKLAMEEPVEHLDGHTNMMEYSGHVLCEVVFKPNPDGFGNVDLGKLPVDVDDDWDVFIKPRSSKISVMALVLGAISVALLIVVILLLLLATVVQPDSNPSPNFCATDVDCSTPAGTCIAGSCLCEAGFSGAACGQRSVRFSPTVSASSTMDGAVGLSTFRDSIARLQPGITADDVHVDSVEQTVGIELVVPGPPQAFDVTAQMQMADALMSVVAGATQVEISGLTATTVNSGRRQLQVIAGSAVVFRVVANQDTSQSWRNVSAFAASFATAAAKMCNACSSFERGVVLSDLPDVTTLILYRIAPVLATQAEAVDMAAVLTEMVSSADHDQLLAAAINEIAKTTLVNSVRSTALPAFVSQAFTQLTSGDSSIFEQLMSVFSSVRGAVTSGPQSQELSFGGWRLQVDPARSNKQCTFSHLQSSPRLGDILQDANSTLAPGILNALRPLLAAQLTDVTITACYSSRLMKIDSTLTIFGKQTELRLAANEENGAWQYTLTANAGGILRALQASFGNFVNSFQIPTGVYVVISALLADHDFVSGIKIGSISNRESVLASLDVDIHQRISTAVSNGAAGSFAFGGHTIAMRLNADVESGLRFGAVLDTPVQLENIVRPVLSELQDMLGPGGDAVSALLGELLRPVLEVEVSELLLAAKSEPPSLSLTGSMMWRGAAMRFDAILSIDPSWKYALLLDLPDIGLLDLQAMGLESFGIDNLGLLGSPSIMLASSDADGEGGFQIGNWQSDSLAAVGTDVAAMQELAIARTIVTAKEFALEAISEGLSGTISYHGRDIAMFCKTDTEKGFVIGADVSGEPLNVGQALGSALQTVHAGLVGGDGGGSGSLGVLLDGLSEVLDLSIDNLAFQAYTSPGLSLRVAGDISWRGVTSSMEFFLSHDSSGWEWALSCSQDASVLLDLLGPVQEYVQSLTPSATGLAVMFSAGSTPPIRIGQTPGTRMAGKDLTTVLDLHAFVAERLDEGFEATIDIGVPVGCSVRCTAAGLYMSAIVVMPDPIPLLRDVISTPDLSSLPADIRSTISALLSTGIASLELHIWTGAEGTAPTVILAGELRLGVTFVRFVFTARRPSSTWDFDLAVATDLSEYLWSRIDFSQIPTGLRSTFGLTAQPPSALQALAVKVGQDEAGLNFEIGAFAEALQSVAVQAARSFSSPSDVPAAFKRGIDLRNVQLGPIQVDLFMYASTVDVYASVSVPLISTSTLSDSLASALDIDIATAVATGVPTELQAFTTLLRDTSLQNFRCHIFSDGLMTKTSVVGLIEGTDLESLVFQAATNRSEEWTFVVSFDAVAFFEEHLSSLDFLGLNRRRCQEDGLPAFLLSHTPVGVTASIGISLLSPDTLLSPNPTEHSVPGLASVCQRRPCTAGEIVQPLTFDFGTTTADVSISAVFTEQSGTPASSGVVVQVSVGATNLGDVIASTVTSSSFGGDCSVGAAAGDAAAGIGATIGAIMGRRSLQNTPLSSAMYCELHSVLSTVSMDGAFLRAMVTDNAEWSAELAVDGLFFAEVLLIDLRFVAIHSGAPLSAAAAVAAAAATAVCWC
jgi:hypothetical protein